MQCRRKNHDLGAHLAHHPGTSLLPPFAKLRGVLVGPSGGAAPRTLLRDAGHSCHGTPAPAASSAACRVEGARSRRGRPPAARSGRLTSGSPTPFPSQNPGDALEGATSRGANDLHGRDGGVSAFDADAVRRGGPLLDDSGGPRRAREEPPPPSVGPFPTGETNDDDS